MNLSVDVTSGIKGDKAKLLEKQVQEKERL